MRRTLPHFRSLIEEQPLCSQNRAIMLGITRHVFTLRADMARLRRFIDSYLNFVDDDMPPPFYFQPAAPFVMFELLYYPYLTVASRNLVSYPQREMSFSIPIECYAIEDGVLVFKQYAVCVPFLYVDEELSVISGRNLFGLPKVALKFNDLIDQVRPDFPTQIGRLTLRVPGGPLGDVYAPFIEVYRDAQRYISLRQTPANLINALPDAIRGYSTFAADAWEAIARPPIRGYDSQRDLQSMLGMLRANADTLSAGFPIFPFMRQAPQFARSSADEQLGPLFSDIISLKQARDAEHPKLVSYQSLVRSTIYLDRLNDGGFLFGPLANDPSSDITIKIHHLQGQPLVESLGLVTEDTTAVGGSGRSVAAGGRSDTSRDAGPMVSTLKPVFPYWLNVDLAYGMGTTLYWRGRNTQWSSTNNPGPPGGPNRYLTFGSGAMAEEASMLVSPESVIWVFQLPLDVANEGPQRLNRLCSEYLRSDCYVFQLAEGVGETSIWMFVRNMDNTSEGKGPDVEQEVEFAAMVQWFEKKDGRACGPALGAAMMPLYVLTDNQTAVFTESEVYGRPTVCADIDFEGENWTSGSVAAVMNAKTLLLPELYAGGAPDNRRIVRLEAAFPTRSLKEPRGNGNGNNPKVLRFPTVALKQIEDCRLPDRVDFQAIVFRLLRIQGYSNEAIQDLNPPAPPFQLFDSNLWSVNIYRYESLPLVRKMGLEVSYQKPSEYTTVDVIRPCKVWALGASIEELGAVNLAWRQGDSPWMTYDNPLAELDKLEPGITEDAQALPRGIVDLLNGLSVASMKSATGVTSILRGDTIQSSLEESPKEVER